MTGTVGVLSLLSLVVFGWLTLAIGLVVGALLGILRARDGPEGG